MFWLRTSPVSLTKPGEKSLLTTISCPEENESLRRYSSHLLGTGIKEFVYNSGDMSDYRYCFMRVLVIGRNTDPILNKFWG